MTQLKIFELAANGGAMCPVGITAHSPIKLHLN